MIWIFVLQLTAFGLPTMPPPPPPPVLFQQAQEGPKHLPSHRMGPHEGEPGAICYRGETQTSATRTMYHCACKLVCEGMDIREQDDCETSCSPNGDQCKCHADEQCDAPEIQTARPR